MIRILQVLGRLDRGGAETMIMNLYRQMDRSEVQFDFVIHTDDSCDYDEEVWSLGGKIYSVPAFGISSAFTYRNAWKTLLKEHPEYKILHSHVRSTASLYLPLARKAGLKTIVHAHNTSSGTGMEALGKGILQYPLRFQADYLFACGKQAGEWLFGKRACEKSNFIILKNAIDLDLFQPKNEERIRVRTKQRCMEQLVIGHVGRFEDQKNHRFLIEIFEKVHRMEPKAVLWLIGTGVKEEEIRHLVAEKKIEQFVHFLGNREDVNKLMQGMDCFLFPSKFEGLPVTLVEAQAVGMPILASAQITEEVCITTWIERLSLSENQSKWAEKLLAMCKKQAERKNGHNAESLKKIRESGYSITDTGKWLMGFYRKLQGKV